LAVSSHLHTSRGGEDGEGGGKGVIRS
jgi:hypothetical protein